MTANKVIIDVVVSLEDIEKKTYVCNTETCLVEFSSERSLKKHLCECHQEVPISDITTKIIYRFNCPIKNCRRSLKMDRDFFTTRKHLHQHYYKVHGAAKFGCTNDGCRKVFSTQLLRNIHLKNCGKVFICQCGGNFNSNEALLTHQKRKHPTMTRERKIDKSIQMNNNDYSNIKLDNSPTSTRTVSTTTTGLDPDHISLRTSATNTISVFTTADHPISSTSTSIPRAIKNSSTSTAEDLIKEENSNSLSSSSSNKKNVNWNSLTGGDFDDSINLFDDNDVKMEFYSAETQTDFTENLFNNNYTQTTFSDFYDFEKFDIQTQTNWDEWRS